jgi:hypothetical protein
MSAEKIPVDIPPLRTGFVFERFTCQDVSRDVREITRRLAEATTFLYLLENWLVSSFRKVNFGSLFSRAFCPQVRKLLVCLVDWSVSLWSGGTWEKYDYHGFKLTW